MPPPKRLPPRPTKTARPAPPKRPRSPKPPRNANPKPPPPPKSPRKPSTAGRHVVRKVVLALLLFALPARADERAERLAAGEIILETEEIPGSAVPRVTMTAVIEAPPAEVWPLIEDCAGYKHVMPRTSESELLSREGNVTRCRAVIDAPWPAKDLNGIVRAELVVGDGRWVRRWELESGDYVRNTGSWTLTAFGAEAGRTLAVYRLHAEPKSSVPGVVRDFAQKRALPGILESLREATAKRRAAAARASAPSP